MLPVLACAVVLGCRDLLSSDRPGGHLAQPSAAHTLGVLNCLADVRAGTLACSATRPATTAGAHPAILGQNQMKMASANVAFDAGTRVFRADVTTQNLLTEAIGTPDGTTVSGVKVFFSSGPVPTSFSAGDTGTVRVENPDGYGNFTAAHQPYFLYSQIVAPNQISAIKQWRWYLGPTVNTFSFQVKVFAATPSEVPVPLSIPQGWGQPRRYFTAPWQVDCSAVGLPRCVYDVVDIEFQPDASQEERQAAIEAIGGTLESGSRMTARYYVRIGSDTSLIPVQTALRTLRALPQVRRAFPHNMTPLALDYLRADDGAHWHTRDWQMKDSLASGHTWALTAVSAPLAWGCATGNSLVNVAVVDHNFRSIADLDPVFAPGMTHGVGEYVSAQDAQQHGTEIAAIIAAHGNDGAGMTGTLWRSSLRLYEAAADSLPGIPLRQSDGSATLDADTIVSRVQAAAMDGATVINLSIGIDWNIFGSSNHWVAAGTPYDPSTEQDLHRDSLNRNTVDNYASAFRNMLDTLSTKGIRPLIVLSAGNNGIDAWWNGFTAGTEAAANVLIVGAVRGAGNGSLAPMSLQNGAITYGSNAGPMVAISAPGQGVWSYNSGGEAQISGTSFAAPYVTGVAGLLVAFDPSLAGHSDLLKALLIAGAQRGRRRIVDPITHDSIPVLNAYESLKLAALRPGAPLCGSRVWQANSQIYTQRDTTPGAPGEALFASTAHVTDIQVRHGGRRVEIHDRDGGGYRLFEWHAPGAWMEVPDSAVRYDSIFITTAPSYHSYYGESHDGDSIAYADLVGGSYQIHVQHIDTITYQTLSDAVVASIPNGESGDMSAHACTYQTGAGCYDSVAVGTARAASVSLPAFSPTGDSLLFAISWTTTTVSVGSPYTCPDWWAYPDQPPQCADVTTSWSADGGNLYAIPLHGSGGARVVATTGGAFREIAIADGAGEFTAQVVTRSGTGITSYTGAHRWDKTYSGSSNETCRTEFRPLKNPATVAAFFNECSPAAATFSPNRNPLGAPALGSIAAASRTFPASGRVPRIFSAGNLALAPLPRRR